MTKSKSNGNAQASPEGARSASAGEAGAAAAGLGTVRRWSAGRQREVGLQVLLDEPVEGGVLGATTGVDSRAASLRVGGHGGGKA